MNVINDIHSLVVVNLDVLQQFCEQLRKFVSESRVILDPLRTLAYGTDASCYRLVPKAVLLLDNETEVSRVLQLAAEFALPVTFRAAGTSLSGQAITDSILIKLTNSWRNHEILNDGELIRVQPGLIGARVNQILAPLQRKIGPDPASINSCKIGGIAANNSSGMCCGTAQNSYSTLKAMRLILADGTILDTADEQSKHDFRISHKHLLHELAQLAIQTKNDAQLATLIKHKFRLKNTTGYSINALVDFTDPIDILMHLMIGSEGTLGFISNITYHTVPEQPFKASSLVVFENIETTCLAVAKLKQMNVAAVELMDGASLQAIADKPDMPAFIAQLNINNAALLIETRANDQFMLSQQISQLAEVLAEFKPIDSIAFTQDRATCEQLWAIRKGLFPAVGAVRDTGTTVIIEDIAVAVEQLASATRQLQQLFSEYGYHEAIIFGHALDGNLHFVFTQDFNSLAQIERYQNFMQRVVQLIALDHQGSLKAEHGTGRNMAPFVELEWGKKAYELMWEIKGLLDPDNILSPGVVLSEDPFIHLKNLKTLPAADAIIDKCIECGFCEPNCPSKDLTLTPRQRIVLWRHIQQRRNLGESEKTLKPLLDAFQYQGIDTCAATGLCADSCPVGIDTGALIKQLRSQQLASHSKLAKWSAANFGRVTNLAKHGLDLAQLTSRLLGRDGLKRLTEGLNHASGHRFIKWSQFAPVSAPDFSVIQNLAANLHVQPEQEQPTVVYFPSCSSRVMGPDPDMAAHGELSLMETTIVLLHKAGFRVIMPEATTELCCGMAYQSKGRMNLARQKSHQLEHALLTASEHGKYPIYMDTSPCAMTANAGIASTLKIYDSVEFIDQFVLPRLTLTPLDEPVMLHITCSTHKRGLATTMQRIAAQCTTNLIVPPDMQCCGFAGDKGLLFPELNTAALADLKGQVPEGCHIGVSNSRTCEIGLSEHSGISYKGLVYLVNQVSEALN
ncbi:FAD-binding and (Fe-S)-binding domain-containing protein [Motilimonas cestriensis]|uniref:FAD-binding and (Fe-S)-binding domain-containing protein n=1 Tax=Motilimonas cestriensis TaxID=2742685 RepID=UPI003DA4104A